MSLSQRQLDGGRRFKRQHSARSHYMGGSEGKRGEAGGSGGKETDN